MIDTKPPPGYARIYLDIAHTQHRWKTSRAFLVISLVFTALHTTVAVGYATTLNPFTWDALVFPLAVVGMSLCANLASWAHCITIKGFADMATDASKHDQQQRHPDEPDTSWIKTQTIKERDSSA